MLNLNNNAGRNSLKLTGHPLDVLFSPGSVAVIGASERKGSAGRVVVTHLLKSDFPNPIYPINPKRETVLGLKAYPQITDVPQAVDLAIIATPVETVLAIIGQCVEAGVEAAIILSSGFKETGPEGAALEAQILQVAREGRMRIVGPNCLGVMVPDHGLNATFASQPAIAGSVGFVSQSGALCSAVLDWSVKENVGFSAFVSVGSMLDVGWGDLITYFGDDPHTKSIIMYMETIGEARAFLSAAREVALTKPIIVIKPGRTPEAAVAAASHTGALAGQDAVISAAFRRCGVLRVNEISELFSMAEILAKQPRTTGHRLTIVTNAGGPGVLATDALVSGGGQLAAISAEDMQALNDILPKHWSKDNPIDILGDAGAVRYEKVLEIVLNDKESDGLLVILTPQAMAEPTETAAAITRLHNRPAGYPYGKPVLASWMGGDSIAEGEAILNQVNIPTFPYPDAAARSFNYMWKFQHRLQSLYETPHLPRGYDESSFKRFIAGEIFADLRRQGRTLLTELESKQILNAYGIPVVDTLLAQNPDEAEARARSIGYPVVLKINSSQISHKKEAGGIRLNLKDGQEVRAAFQALQQAVEQREEDVLFEGVTVQPMVDQDGGFELIVGSSPDSQFGPVLLFGQGGSWVDIFADTTLELPPLNTTLARRMMERTRIYQALLRQDAAGEKYLSQLEDLLVLFSQLVVEQQWIKAVEINPLLWSVAGLVALDARIVLYDLDVAAEDLPPLAIRPYPDQYVQEFTNKKGVEFVIRPIRPEDEPALVHFHSQISEKSIYLRYFRALNLSSRIEHERMVRMAHVDYDRTIALVVEWHNPATGEDEIVAHGHLTRLPNPKEAEFAMLVRDDFQRQGLGTVILKRLLKFGRDEGIEQVEAYMLAANKGMIAVCRKLGFTFGREDELVKAVIEL